MTSILLQKHTIHAVENLKELAVTGDRWKCFFQHPVFYSGGNGSNLSPLSGYIEILYGFYNSLKANSSRISLT
jgi:hypothetical protein